jgi:rod shape-determining protein MreD
MAERAGQGLLAIAVSLAVALVLTVFPLPEWAQPYRPQWPLMVLAYWCMALPHRVGVAAGWLTGLLTDVLTGTLLGQHALGYALAMYLVLTMHQRLRLFPWWQQAAALGGIFATERLISFLVTGATNGQPQTWSHWLAPLVSTALWPWLFIIMRDVRRKFGVR